MLALLRQTRRRGPVPEAEPLHFLVQGRGAEPQAGRSLALDTTRLPESLADQSPLIGRQGLCQGQRGTESGAGPGPLGPDVEGEVLDP